MQIEALVFYAYYSTICVTKIMKKETTKLKEI